MTLGPDYMSNGSDNTTIFLNWKVNNQNSLRYQIRKADNGRVMVSFALLKGEEWSVSLIISKNFAASTGTSSTDVPVLQVIECRSDSTLDIIEMVWLTLFWCFQQNFILERFLAPLSKAGAPKAPPSIELYCDGSFLREKQLEKLEKLGLGLADDTKKDGEIRRRRFLIFKSSFWQLHPGYFCRSYSSPPVPPKPLMYTLTNNVRHPLRPLAPQSPDPFYHRHIRTEKLDSIFTLRPCLPSDKNLLHKWMNNERVAAFWGEQGPIEHQIEFINKNRQLAHSFPVIGSWQDIDSSGELSERRDACYFEIYWVKEDHLARYTDDVGLWDRGVHVLVGEEWARGRVSAWLGSLVHFMFLDDPRTQCLFLEPRVDNKRFLDRLQQNGFYKEKEFAFPHKQSALMKLKRDAWDGPL